MKQPNSPSRATFSVLFSVVFLDNLGFAIVVPYLYFYIQSLGGDTLLYGVLLAAYSLMSFVTTPIVARLSDRYGRRVILLAGLAVASLAYFIFGAAQVLWLLFLGRMLSGTTAATVPVAQAYVADVTTKFEQMVDKNDEILNILSSSHNKKAGLSTLLLLTVTTSTIAVGSRVGLSVGSAWQPIRTKINQDDDKHDRRRILFCCRMIFSIQ